MTKQLAEKVLTQLSQSLEQLADAVADQPRLAAALRYERTRLPLPVAAESTLLQPQKQREPMRDLLYSALADGALDYRRFDALMVRTRRASRLVKAKRRRRAA